MNDFCAADVGNGLTVGRPENVADADVVVGDSGLSMPSESQRMIRSLPWRDRLRPRGSLRTNATRLPSGEGTNPRPDPVCSRRPWERHQNGDLPQIAVVRKIDEIAVFTPENAIDLPCGKEVSGLRRTMPSAFAT